MLKIKTEKIHDTAVTVPGSKSYTHRTFIAAALSDGVCHIENWLDSDDTNYTLSALNQFGASFDKTPEGWRIGSQFWVSPVTVRIYTLRHVCLW